MFENAGKFLMESFLKFGERLPSSPFDLDSQVSSLRNYLGHINYFIPFYIFKNIFSAWLVCVFGAFGIYIFIKFIRNLLGK